MIRLGLQIPNFTYPDVAPDELFERVSSVAQTAEQNGFDTVMVMDHFYQLPLLGPPENEMFEAYTLLGALAARTEKVMLGTLVAPVTSVPSITFSVRAASAPSRAEASNTSFSGGPTSGAWAE